MPTLPTSSQPKYSQNAPLLNHGPSRGRASASDWDGWGPNTPLWESISRQRAPPGSAETSTGLIEDVPPQRPRPLANFLGPQYFLPNTHCLGLHLHSLTWKSSHSCSRKLGGLHSEEEWPSIVAVEATDGMADGMEERRRKRRAGAAGAAVV